MKGLRQWVGHCCYPDKSMFYLGNVEADGEMAAVNELKKLWERISPHPAPPTIVAIPGILILEDHR